MKQFFSRSIRRWISFIALLLISLTVGIIYVQRTTQPATTWISAPIPSSTQSPACPKDERAMRISFLSSRSFCIHLLSEDIVSNSIAMSHSWMPHQTRLIASILADTPSKSAAFLDIGANIGWFTLVMATLGHKVIAIEPMQNNVKLLQASVHASQVSQNVIVHPNGLGVKPSLCILYSDNRNVGDGHTICDITSEEEASRRIPGGYSLRQVINSTRLDTLVNQNIDVMKIDVEGSELYAVQSGIRLFDEYTVRHVISEFSPRMMREKQSDPYEYLKFFASRGYSIRIVTDQLASLYEQKAWQSVPTHKSDDDLRRLSNGEQIELWFTKT
ncbi:unnamed protein product [Adineta ricciae]|uniref:Methyltransferase FkbM domain-containing protein n=2 Tax=Adineta ricciae TaxID=249248 RepID=A0A814ZB50_ADIRI|nr:unnamed protein product [Adineta ricciae]